MNVDHMLSDLPGSATFVSASLSAPARSLESCAHRLACEIASSRRWRYRRCSCPSCRTCSDSLAVEVDAWRWPIAGSRLFSPGFRGRQIAARSRE
jgi:hypothetical protein